MYDCTKTETEQGHIAFFVELPCVWHQQVEAGSCVISTSLAAVSNEYTNYSMAEYEALGCTNNKDKNKAKHDFRVHMPSNVEPRDIAQ